MGTIQVAAIQMRARVGDVAGNLSHAESLVREAFRPGAEWVILPEFFTSAGAFAPSMLSAWLPLEGLALELLRKLARAQRRRRRLVPRQVGARLLQQLSPCFSQWAVLSP